MSKIRIIQFDASIRNGLIGIGVIDRSNNKSIVKTLKRTIGSNTIDITSEDAEMLALIRTLQYIKEYNIPSARLFGDNMNIVEKGISQFLQDKYLKGRAVTVHWLPRELNTLADKLSKQGSATKCLNIDANFNTKMKIKEYPYKQRINFLKKIANTNADKKVLHKIENNLFLTSKNKNFLKLCISIIHPGESKSIDFYLSDLSKNQRKSHRYPTTVVEKMIFKKMGS